TPNIHDSHHTLLGKWNTLADSTRSTKQMHYSSLNNLSNGLSDLGRREEALVAIAEAVGIRRDLSASRPAAFLPDLASSLNNQSSWLSDLGRREEAVKAAEEAVLTLWPYFKRWPEAFGGKMQMMRRKYGEYLREVGRGPEAKIVSILQEIDQALAEWEETGSPS
ncbi:MAG: tetratricopeptide repeat protein, partial [Magnetococcales bacterium]|nr:tetratricopeptide repeat protein [Magnetococcales bacterium]MBF0322749.1 tetratricopeptide repeat protein [Magnetococcales bacterium]